MHVTRDRLYMFDWRGGQDSVAEVEDVARTARRSRQHVVGRRQDAVQRAQQHRRVEVALNRAVRADALPRLVERRPPVGAEDVAARFAQLGENGAGADAEMNRRNAERREPLEDATDRKSVV